MKSRRHTVPVINDTFPAGLDEYNVNMESTNKTVKRSRRQKLLLLIGIFLGLCLILSIVSILSNTNLPQAEHSDRISALDKARLLEALHLKGTLGDQVWPDWGTTEIPVIVWNEGYEFLVEYPDEPPADWTIISDDNLEGKTYYRRRADDPQNFAVAVGDSWVASMATKSSTDEFLIESFKDLFPPPIKQIFPYRLLIQPSETQIGGLLHETFHVYQIEVSPNRLKTAEAAHKSGDQYNSVAEGFQSEWKKESALLAEALRAESKAKKIELVKGFLAIRDARRRDHHLSNELLDYERWLEWEEGVAKYVEVAILKEAFETRTYQPLPEILADPDFDTYQKFNQRWSQELIQLRYQTTSGESQFYMTGMAQAFLLDGLMSDWKEKILEENTFLEDLLRQGVMSD